MANRLTQKRPGHEPFLGGTHTHPRPGFISAQLHPNLNSWSLTGFPKRGVLSSGSFLKFCDLLNRLTPWVSTLAVPLGQFFKEMPLPKSPA